VELDLDPEGLVGISDHVLPLVLGRGRCARETLELAVKVVVVRQRAVALRNLLTLDAEELLPESLRILLFALDPLSIACGGLDRTGVELSPLGSLDGRLLFDRERGWSFLDRRERDG